jgi:protein transport protein SEC23
MLGLLAPALRPQHPAPGAAPRPYGASSRFLLPLNSCEFQLTSTIEQLQKDPWSVANDRRPARCTGAALSVAVGLMETSFPNSGTRVLLYSGGPCTEGPGMVVGTELKEPIRSHHDIERDNAKYYRKASKVFPPHDRTPTDFKYYEALAKRAAANGHVVDIFSGALDQVGLLEMRSLPNYTGGHLILSDSFTTSIFKQSLMRMFSTDEEGNLDMAFNATLDVKCTKEIKVSGLIGHAISATNKSSYVGETEIGIGGTSTWKMAGVMPRSSYGVYFEIVSQGGSAIGVGGAAGPSGSVQFMTHYMHSSGSQRLRVTTVNRPLRDGGSPEIPASFDQETAAVLMARVAVFKSEVDDGP